MKRTINTTLVLIMKDGKMLLAKKKRGFAMGTYNGIGGKQDPGETIEEAMIRECQEEIGATPTKYEQVGLILFDTLYKGERVNLNLNIYTCSEYKGSIVETEEMCPEWFSLDNIPFDQMLPDDREWHPIVLAGKCVFGKVYLKDDLSESVNNFGEISKEDLQKEIDKLYGKTQITK